DGTWQDLRSHSIDCRRTPVRPRKSKSSRCTQACTRRASAGSIAPRAASASGVRPWSGSTGASLREASPLVKLPLGFCDRHVLKELQELGLNPLVSDDAERRIQRDEIQVTAAQTRRTKE